MQTSSVLSEITSNAANANNVLLQNMRKKLSEMLVLENEKILSQSQNSLNSVLSFAKHLDSAVAQNIGKTFEKKISNHQDALHTLESKLAQVKAKLISDGIINGTTNDTAKITYDDMITAIMQLQKFGLESALDFILVGKITLSFTKS